MIRNKNFPSWKIGVINIRLEKDDQKIVRVIHEIAKAKLSVCFLQELRLIITDRQNNLERKYELY